MSDKKRNYNYLIQDFAMLLFIITISIVTLITYVSDSQYRLENEIMIITMFLGILLTVFSSYIYGIVIAAAQTVFYTSYKIFQIYSQGINVSLVNYLWIILPIVSVLSIMLYTKTLSKIELENILLKEQVEKAIMIDPLTGLYNINCFYHDLRSTIKYSQRNNIPITVMIAKLRYGEELRKILSKNEYEELLQKMAKIFQDTIRFEDKLFILEEHGKIGTILTCDSEGANIVAKRIKNSMGQNNSFWGIADRSIIVDIQIGFKEYNSEFGDDVIGYKSKVEGEMQYDV